VRGETFFQLKPAMICRDADSHEILSHEENASFVRIAEWAARRWVHLSRNCGRMGYRWRVIFPRFSLDLPDRRAQ
jgi:hypothetical protein